MRWLALFVPLLFFMPYFAPADSNAILLHLKGGEIKTLEFPLGTKIKQIVSDGNIEISKAAGIKNGQRILFLNIFSEGKTDVKIEYELPEKPLFNKDEHDFLIICPDEWITDLQPLAEQKEQYGIKTVIVGLNEIYEGKYFAVNGRDDAEKIKYFIKDAIEEWGIKYVMLVGGRKSLKDEWLMPVRYVWLNDRSSSWEYERCFLSDLYFADIYDADGKFSSWDTNNNGYYGEYDHELNGKKVADEVDLYPDVYVGRLAARNKMELKKVIENIIEYERNPSSKFNNVVLCGGDLYLHDPWDVAEGEYLLDKIAEEMKGYNIIKLYASSGLNARKINEAINGGAGFVIFEGAGNHHLWATHAKDDEKWIFYYERNILQLKNDYLPIVLTSGARLGTFNRSRECFNWFFVARGKAIASIGPTGLCWIGHGKNVTEMFLGNLHVRLCKRMASRCLLGDAWGEAIIEYLSNFSWRGVAKAFHMKAAEELEIFGDPTLKIGGYERLAAKTNNVLHVGGDGPNNYTKIQDAIDDANDGDTIIVHTGTYNEDLFIDKSLKIIGEGAEIKTNGIVISASDVFIEGFIVEGYKKGTGLLCYGDNISIRNNEIRHFNTSIFVEGSSCHVEENEIKNNECGIWLNGSYGAEIKNNFVTDNWYGVWGEYASSPVIQNNNFSYNAWYAVWMEGKDGQIGGNDFYRNWYCIYLYNSRYFIINNNSIYGNIHGPQFVNSSYNIIEDNTITKNEHYGIYFGWRSIENVIRKNNFIENAQNARDDAGNKWQDNYWSDYIGLKIKLLYLLHIPYYIPKFSFDWHPAIQPQ